MRLDRRGAGHSVRLRPSESYSAGVSVDDPDGDPLTFDWRIMAESAATQTGGDIEAVPPELTGLIAEAGSGQISLRAPANPGAYRLFVYATDGQGAAAHANIPFYVDP